jgi:hypothetical protein
MTPVMLICQRVGEVFIFIIEVNFHLTRNYKYFGLNEQYGVDFAVILLGWNSHHASN